MSIFYGVGLDIGTSNLIAAKKICEDKEEITKIRDCYLELKDEDIDFLQTMGDWKIVTINNRHFALGEDSFKISNWLKNEVKRPMAQGVVNPTDDDAVDILEELITKILGAPRYPGEICVCSIPANSADGEIDTTPHKGAVKQIITKLGYTFQQINEGYATLLALNPKAADSNGDVMPFTGIGISFGGGMVNLSVAYKGKPLKELEMSTARSGDWVDQMVAKSFGKDPTTNVWRIKSNQVTKFKEEYFQFDKNYTDAEIDTFGYKSPERKKYFRKMMNNLNLYYENLMEFTIAAFVEQFVNAERPIEESLEIVISGGTSTPKGFETKFKEILDSSNFPIAIKNVRKAENTLNSTVTGALAWAINLEQKKKNIAP